MGNLTQSNANATLSYQGNLAKVRVPEVSYTFGLNANESKARQHRAFYPHRRNQGGFSVRVECAHWPESNDFANWLREYAEAMLDLGRALPIAMHVQVPSRNFDRYGIPCGGGITYGDHLGSNVFSHTVEFLSLNDPRDPSTAILDPSTQASRQVANGDPILSGTYPAAVIGSPGGVQDALYNYQQQLVLLTARDTLISTIQGIAKEL